MKKEYLKSLYKIISIGLFLLIFSDGFSQVQKAKRFNGEFNNIQALEVNHGRGALNIRKSQDGTLRYEAEIEVKAESEEAANAVLERYKVKEDKFNSKLELNSKLQFESWNNVNGLSRIKFKDGTKIKGVKSIDVSMIVYIPDLSDMTLKNRYEDINVHDNFDGNLNVDLFSGKLRTVNIGGAVDIKAKYSKIYIGNCGDLDLDIFDSDMEAGNAGKVKAQTKYSKYTLGNLEKLEGTIFDSKFKTGDIRGDVVINDKYSEFEFGDFKNGKIDIYDGVLEAKNAGTIDIKSKYSEFKFTKLEGIDFESSFDDALITDHLGTLSATSKYSEYEIGHLTNSAKIVSSFDDALKIDELDSGFDGITIDGKYTKVEVEKMGSTKFHLDVNMMYGKIDYPEDELEVNVWKEKGSSKEIKAKVKGASDSAGKIEVRGHDNTIKLN